MNILHGVVVATVLAANSAAQGGVDAVVRGFAPFDLDGDGRAEVRSLGLVASVGAGTDPVVVVLVEGRVWRGGGDDSALQQALRRHAEDVAAEGHRVLLLAADVHEGPPHQDGRTVLALRRLFQRVHARAPMAGAVLVGHFPDAQLVRTCNWRRNEVLSLPGKDGLPVAIDAKTTNVRCVPEVVAHRCDAVLADLDGDWERVYVPGPATLRSAWAVFGDTVPDAGGPCVALQEGELAVTDVFHVRDGAAVAQGKAFTLHLDAADRDHECSAADRTRGNPLALPDLAISRIDARGVAWRPEPRAFATVGEPEAAFQGGYRLLEVPTTLRAADGQPPAPVQWQSDARREQQLLVDYFARNHAFRTTPLPAALRRPAAIAHGLGSGLASLRAADPAWATFAEPGHDVDGADLLALRRWLQQPAVLRTLRVHSDPWGGAFAKSDPAALASELGVPWHWVEDGAQRVPSWKDHAGGRADFAFYRAVHGKDRAQQTPFLLVHTGCEALSPPHSERPYDAPEYGRFAHAESILFFTGCLAIVGRAKVFYDEPRGFAEALGEGKTFGAAWQRYFAIESEAKDWREVGDDIGRKRAYFWSLVGDWTLRLPRAS